jgi:tetratricopeptide (TPR) repeat protein
MRMILLFLLAIVAHSTGFALPPQVEADRLSLEAKKAFDQEDYATAAKNLEALKNTNTPLPASFSYLYGLSLFKTGQFDLARQYLDDYLTRSGSSGKYYKEALEAYSANEKKSADYIRRMEAYKKDLADYEGNMASCGPKYQEELHGRRQTLNKEFEWLHARATNYGFNCNTEDTSLREGSYCQFTVNTSGYFSWDMEQQKKRIEKSIDFYMRLYREGVSNYCSRIYSRPQVPSK